MAILTNQVGLSITEDKVQLVEISHKDNSLFLENVDEEFFEESIFEDTKEAKFIYVLQNSFNEILLRKPLNSNKISVTLPPSYFKIFELPVDKNLTKNDLNDYIKWEISKLFPYEKSDNFTFQKVVLNPLHFEVKKQVLVYVISINILKRIHKFCVRNNFKLKSIDSSHIATIGFLSNRLNTSDVLSLYVENNKISASLYSNGNITFEKTKNYTSIPEVIELTKDFIKEIEERKLIKGKIEELRLFGNSISKELKTTIDNSIDIDLQEISPFQNLQISDSLKESKFVTETFEKFAPTAAIALRI